jgi:hypothetical protein
MERRYLVATLAVIATFAVFSHGLRTVEPALLSYSQNAGANLKAKCNADTSAVSRFMSKVRTYLSPDYPDEAQLMADMNLPIAMAQAKAAEEVARQNIAAAQCARDTALRQAELGRREADRAQRQAARMRDRMAHKNAIQITWGANMAADIDRQVRAQTAAIAKRIAAQSARMAAEQMQVSLQISDSAAASADNDQAESDSNSYSNHSSSRTECSGTQVQQEQAIRARGRVLVHQVQQSFGFR